MERVKKKNNPQISIKMLLSETIILKDKIDKINTKMDNINGGKHHVQFQ